jgi:DUF1680 family protein
VPNPSFDVRLPRLTSWRVRHDAALLRGITVLETEGVVLSSSLDTTQLYRPLPAEAARHVPLRLVPYYAWANRGPSEMTVWIPLANP